MLPIQENVSVDDIQDRLAEWQQGDFTLECGELLFLDLPEDENDPYEPVFDEDVSGCVVISQTCDIVREIGILPNVTVCPLIKINTQRKSDIEKGQAPRYGLIDDVPDGVVADFSRAMSVSKNLLVTWERRRGCSDEKHGIEFARSLERFFGRFAFPDAFNDSLQSLRKAIYSKHEKNSDLGAALRSIRELRAYPHANWNNEESVPVTFFVILENDADREVKDRNAIMKAISEKFMGIDWHEPFSLHEQGLYLATLSDITAAEYLNSYPLDLNALSYARRFQKEI